MKSWLFTLVSLIIYISAFPQKNFVPGYLIKPNGDTIRGFLPEETRGELLHSISFKMTGAGELKSYSVTDINGFKFDNGNLYKTISFTDPRVDSLKKKTYFANQLLQGYYNLYEFVEEERIYFVAQTDSNSWLLYNGTYRSDGQINEEGNYLNKLILLSVGCETLQARVEQVEYNTKALMTYFTELNKCLYPEKPVNNYYKKAKIETSFYVFAGGIASYYHGEYTADGLFRFINPQFSRKTSLNIGFRFSNLTSNKDELSPGNIKYQSHTRQTLLCVPATVQYNILTGVVQPYVSAGFYVGYVFETTDATYFTKQQENNRLVGSITVEVGIECFITKRFLAKAKYRYDQFAKLPVIGLGYRF